LVLFHRWALTISVDVVSTAKMLGSPQEAGISAVSCKPAKFGATGLELLGLVSLSIFCCTTQESRAIFEARAEHCLYVMSRKAFGFTNLQRHFKIGTHLNEVYMFQMFSFFSM